MRYSIFDCVHIIPGCVLSFKNRILTFVSSSLSDCLKCGIVRGYGIRMVVKLFDFIQEISIKFRLPFA